MNNFSIYNQYLDELKQFVRAEVCNLLEGFKKEEVDEWLTIKETCKYIKVTAPTLWKYTNDGILTKHILGNSPRYKKSEIDKAFDILLPKNGGIEC